MIAEVFAAALGVIVGALLATLGYWAAFRRVGRWQRFTTKDFRALATQQEILLKRWGDLHDQFSDLQDLVDLLVAEKGRK